MRSVRAGILSAAMLAGLAAPALAQAPASPEAGEPPARRERVDINSATPEDLDRLPGIGPVRSAAIVRGRPYRDKGELVERGILPARTYEAIRRRIVARQSGRF